MATPSLKAKLQLLPSQSSSGPIRPWHRPLSTGAGRPRTPAPSGALSLRPPFTQGAREQAPWTVTSSLLPTARKGEALGWLPQRKGMFLLSGNVLQEELASRMRMSPAAPQWHPPRRSSHSSSALPSCEATRPATAEGLAFWRWVPPAVQGPLRPTSMARGCQEQGSPRSLKRPRAARPSLPPGSGWSRWTRPPLPGFTHVPRQALRTPALAQRSAVRPTPSWRAPKGRERRSLSLHRPFAGPSQGTGPGHAPA